jgi:hypothetical protein
MTVTELLRRMDAHLARQDAYLARWETEQRPLLERLRQSNARLAEAAQLLQATRLDIEAQRRQRRQGPFWSADTAPGGPVMSDRLFEPTPDYDTNFDEWLEAQLRALATGAWGQLDIPHLCDELEDVRRHYLRELEWTLTQLIQARLVWDYAPEERSDWWQGHMNETHSHLEIFLDDNVMFRQALGERYPVLYQHAIHGLQRYHRLDPVRFPRHAPWPVEDLIERYQPIPDAWRERWPPEAPPRLP